MLENVEKLKTLFGIYNEKKTKIDDIVMFVNELCSHSRKDSLLCILLWEN